MCVDVKNKEMNSIAIQSSACRSDPAMSCRSVVLPALENPKELPAIIADGVEGLLNGWGMDLLLHRWQCVRFFFCE